MVSFLGSNPRPSTKQDERRQCHEDRKPYRKIHLFGTRATNPTELNAFFASGLISTPKTVLKQGVSSTRVTENDLRCVTGTKSYMIFVICVAYQIIQSSSCGGGLLKVQLGLWIRAGLQTTYKTDQNMPRNQTQTKTENASETLVNPLNFQDK